MTFTTYMRRLTASIAALSLVRHGAERPRPDLLIPFATRASEELEQLAGSVESNLPPRPIQELPTLSKPDRKDYPLLSARMERLSMHIATIHDAVERWIAPL